MITARRAALATVVVFASLGATAGPAGANPSILGSTTADGLIYLPMFADGSVQVIDPATNSVVKTIPNAGDHPLILKETLDHPKIYVSNFGPITAEVGVIDKASGTVVKKIPTFGAPYAVSQISPDGRYLYVPTALSVVQVIDTQTDTVVRTLPIAVLPSPVHLEVSLDGRTIYVMSISGFVTKYDAFTGEILGLPLYVPALLPGWGALSVDGNTLYAINYFSGVSFIDTRTWAVTKNVFLPIGSAPLSATLTQDGSELWIASFGTNEITIMDAHTGAVRDSITTAETPVYVGFSDDGTRAYVSSMGSVSALPPEAGIAKFLLAYLPGRYRAFLDTYDTDTRTRISRLETGDAPVAGVYPG